MLKQFDKILLKNKKFSIKFCPFQQNSAFIDVFPLVELILSVKALAGTIVTVPFFLCFPKGWDLWELLRYLR